MSATASTVASPPSVRSGPVVALALLLAGLLGNALSATSDTPELTATNGARWAPPGTQPPRGYVAISCEESQGCLVAVPPPDAGAIHIPPCNGREGWQPPGGPHAGACWSDMTLPLDLLHPSPAAAAPAADTAWRGEP